MKKALQKDFWMEIRKNKARFISIFVIVALGVAFFSGIQATSPDMRFSGDAYYDAAKLMDIKVVGTLGLTEEDVKALEEVDGVEEAIGTYSTDVYCGEENEHKVVHVECMDERVNLVTATEGRLPKKSGECLLDSVFAGKRGYQVGDTLKFRQDGDSELLKEEEFTVVGIGSSPLYISFNRGNTTLGSGEIHGFVYVLPEDFDQEIYTQIYLRLHNADDLISYTDAYDNLVEKIQKRVEGIEDVQCRIRYDSVVAEAEEELADAQKELDDGKKEAEEELKKAEKELKDGEKELKDGKKEYQDGKKELEDAKKELADGKQELEDARKEIEDGKAQLQDARNELASGRAQLQDAKAQLSDGWAQLNPERTKLASAWQQYHDGEAELEAGAAQLADKKKEVEDGKQALADGKATLDAKQKEIDAAKTQIASGKTELEQTAAGLNEQKQQCQAGLEQVAAAEGQIAELQGAADAAGAAAAQAQEAVNAAQAEYDRISQEVEAGNLSQEELDAAAAALGGAQAGLAEASQTAAALTAQLESTTGELSAKRAELESGMAAIEGGLAQIEQKKTELAESEAALSAGQQEIDQGWAQLKEQESVLAEAEKTIAEKEQEVAAAREELQKNYQTLAAAQDTVNAGVAKLNAAQAEISANEQKLADGEWEIAQNEQKLIDGEREIAENEQKLADGEKEIKENEKKLKDAKKELKDAQKELEDGWKEYEDGKKDADEEIKEGEEKIADARKEIDDLKMPQWYVTDRKALPEYSDYGDNADRIRNIGEVFPVIFFLVAALISLTTMTRMVEEQRTQIGTLKALGYGKYAIASKYLNYAFLATVGGSICGILIGEKILPYIIIKAYGIMYHNMATNLVIDYELKYALIASVAAVVCTVGATVSSCYRVLAETPASLMRPPAPKEGKRVLIERITFLWKHLNFTWKSCLRNLFRYKKRLFMTIFGISGSMGLMLVGFGIRDSISDIPVRQYKELQHYDGTIIDDEDASDQDREELLEYLKDSEKIERFTKVQFNTMTIPRGTSNISCYVYVPENMDNFREDVTLKDRVSGELYELTDEGAVICEKTASLMDLKEGDLLPLKRDNKEYQVRIAAITENYLGHYVYMTPKVYEETFGEKPDYPDIEFTFKEEYKEVYETVGQEILQYPAALSITYTRTVAEQVERMLGTLGLVIVVLIVSAGMLAFVVLYNLNNINITERKRELATLKVLGFFDGEVSQYVLRENILLTLLGILFGSGFGIFLHRFIIVTVEVDSVMFGREIRPISFLYCAVLTCVFSAVVNVAMHFKLKKVDMVESLKSVE